MSTANALGTRTFLAITLLILLSACTSSGEPPTAVPTDTAVPPTRTPFPPSPTPVPIAATVNGEEITMAAYQAELARYKAAVDRDLTAEDREAVIQDMIQLILLAQGAHSQGYQVNVDEIQQRMEQLEKEDQPLEDWLARYGYTEDSFRRSLARAMAAAWMRDVIIDRVPQESEQIHAQQILLYEEGQAESVLAELANGTNFAQLAREYDPQTQGELGWFPRGYLTMPNLDDILFGLEVGEISDMIETEIGYHIIKVLEKDDGRPLAPDVRHVLQKQALHDWLDRQWTSSEITISISE